MLNETFSVIFKLRTTRNHLVFFFQTVTVFRFYVCVYVSNWHCERNDGRVLLDEVIDSTSFSNAIWDVIHHQHSRCHRAAPASSIERVYSCKCLESIESKSVYKATFHFIISRKPHCLNITQKFRILILAFFTNFCPIKTDLSGNTV